MSTQTTREKVTGKNAEGTSITLEVIKPNNMILQEAQLIYNRRLAQLMRMVGEDRPMFRDELIRHLDRIGMWTDADQAHFVAMSLEIRSLEETLRAGGIKKSQAREIAIAIRSKRSALMELYGKRSQYDAMTAEATAEQHRLQWLMVRCCVKGDGTAAFTSIAEYVNRQEEEIVQLAAQSLAAMVFGYKKNMHKALYEEQWLATHKFVNEEGHLIDSQGRLINESGHLVNAQGELVNAEGQVVDPLDRVLDATGGVDVTPEAPFEDDMNTNPEAVVVAEAPAEEKPTVTGRRRRARRTRRGE